MTARGKWQGLLTIVHFNWPLYAVAGVGLLAAFAGVFLIPFTAGKLLCGAVVFGAGYFIVGSLGVSHFIYDRSDLYRYRWLSRALQGASSENFIFCHAGFDETSADLREKWPTASWLVLDHFDAATMTEPSIRRARRRFPPTPGTLPAPFHGWPLAASSAEVVLGLLAIHELRSVGERAAWFAEARRCLHPGGRVIFVEHLRDAANFLAFGPGFVHFHSRANWRRSWESAGWRLRDEFTITPFLRVFVLTAP